MKLMEVTNQATREDVIDEIALLLKHHTFDVTLKVVKKPGSIKIVIPVTEEQLKIGLELANKKREKDGQKK